MQTKTYFWIYIAIVLLASLFAETLIVRDAHFALDGFGFFAWYGFLSSLGLIVVAKLLALFIKRDDHYYQNLNHNDDD